jgi:hypothetical protein
MKFSIQKSFEILESTPFVLSAFLNPLSKEWTDVNEGDKTWTVKEVIAHLIVCEETDWLPRARIILSERVNKLFDPIDMNAHFVLAQKYSLDELLKTFQQRRVEGLIQIKLLNLQDEDFKKSATHPALGEITLQQLIATWVTHDLTHIAQIARVMAKQNKENVGAFVAYLKILK